MDNWLGCKIHSKVSRFVNFLIFLFLCAGSATTFLVLKHCLHHCVVSSNYGESRARDAVPICWSFGAIAWYHLHLWCKQGLLCVVAVFVCFVVVFWGFFSLFCLVLFFVLFCFFCFCFFCCCCCFFSLFFFSGIAI